MRYPGNPYETESRQVVARGCREWGVLLNGYRVLFWSDKNILELD